ncbi:hypothetical protein LRS11_02960 [Pseudomonas sp. J452]|uniref:hypothetical protein n=1 Tax=Pseudomonas sp. J452 TaxID=2898441 RepID=UPI0021AD59A4|nr:hypothetical protein [Pseudomonas sp. J452]UUY09009.1 hypothetical protein LRS11_02960 [Pseudomonas sp. J452]
MTIHGGDGDFRAQKSLTLISEANAKVDGKVILATAALVDRFTGQAETRTFESRDEDAIGVFDLRQPGQAVMHIGLIAADYRIGLLEAEIRSLRIALMSGTPPNDSSLELFPSLEALRDAYLSDLLTMKTGRMPELNRFERRLSNADTRAKITDAARALQIESAHLAARKAAGKAERIED